MHSGKKITTPQIIVIAVVCAAGILLLPRILHVIADLLFILIVLGSTAVISSLVLRLLGFKTELGDLLSTIRKGKCGAGQTVPNTSDDQIGINAGRKQ